MNIQNKKERIYKIYCLKDPRDLSIRYIGVTVRPLHQRLYQHMWTAKQKGTHKNNWINSLKKLDKKPLICLIEYCSYKNWEQKEILWIKRLNNLTNIKKGGTGVVLGRSKESISRSAKGHWVPVIGFTADLKILSFKSVTEVTATLGIPQTNISEVLSKRSICCYGYHFVYAKDYYPGYENTITMSKKLPKNYFIYNNVKYSTSELAKKLDCSTSFLSMISTGKRNWKNSKFFNNSDTLQIIKI